MYVTCRGPRSTCFVDRLRGSSNRVHVTCLCSRSARSSDGVRGARDRVHATCCGQCSTCSVDRLRDPVTESMSPAATDAAPDPVMESVTSALAEPTPVDEHMSELPQHCVSAERFCSACWRRKPPGWETSWPNKRNKKRRSVRPRRPNARNVDMIRESLPQHQLRRRRGISSHFRREGQRFRQPASSDVRKATSEGQKIKKSSSSS